jgi:hypothetical protein
MTAILPHVDRNDALPSTLAFQPRKSNFREDGEEENEEADGAGDGDVSTDSDDSRNPPRTVTARAETIPCNPYGIVFLRSISVGKKVPVPRFGKSPLLQYRALSENAWRHLFGKARDEINEEFFNPSVVRTANPARIPNKVKRTANRQNSEEPILFDLTSKGYKLPDAVVDEGSDQEVGSNGEPSNQGPDDDDSVDTKLSKLWRQFLVDLTAKAPNPKNANSPSYCKLTPEQRLTVDDNVHKNKKLSDYWVDCQWKVATQSEWTLIFNRLWPDKGNVLFGSVQNYPSTAYYIDWTKLTSESDHQTVSAMREDIREMFDSLFWLPHAQTDRIWHTKVMPGFKRSNGVNESKPAPRILINWKATDGPTW